MKGDKWVGVIFDGRTHPEVVFRLFDRAVYAGERRGYTIVLESMRTDPARVYQARGAAGQREKICGAGSGCTREDPQYDGDV